MGDSIRKVARVPYTLHVGCGAGDGKSYQPKQHRNGHAIIEAIILEACGC